MVVERAKRGKRRAGKLLFPARSAVFGRLNIPGVYAILDPVTNGHAIGSLRLLRPIGTGGMGEVWLARDEALGVARAVKILLAKRAGDAAVRARFAAEARTLAALGDVPGVVRVHAAGEDPATRRPFFVMDAHLLSPEQVCLVCTRRLGLSATAAEAVSRTVFAEFASHAESAENAESPFTLQDALGDEASGTARQLPERAVLAIAREIAAPLSVLHGRTPPVVHRDIKPANLLFAADGRLLLADFGIAKAIDPKYPGLTLTGAQPGTQRYAAPELLRGAPATPAADWYALGVVLFRALTSSFPQWGESFPTNAGLRPRSPLWEPLLCDLLASDPARRLSDAAEFLRRLDKLERAIDRSRGGRRRTKAAAALAAAVLAAGSLFVFRAVSRPGENRNPDSGSKPEIRLPDPVEPHAESAEPPVASVGAGEAEPPPIAPTPSPVPGQVRTVLLPGGVPLDLVWVPPGTFTMGLSEKERAPCATPFGKIPGDSNPEATSRRASVPRGFWLAKTELTQEQYAKIVDGKEGLPSMRASCPQYISWHMAERTIWSLNRLGTGFSFRMPTETEWEWAARGGPLGGGHAWSGSDDPADVAWTANSWPPRDQPKPDFSWPPVATRRPNELGLFDMSGSFAEWCSDRYVPPNSARFTSDRPSAQTEYRVVRGGSINTPAAYCRNGSFSASPTDGMVSGLFGLRVAADELP